MEGKSLVLKMTLCDVTTGTLGPVFVPPFLPVIFPFFKQVDSLTTLNSAGSCQQRAKYDTFCCLLFLLLFFFFTFYYLYQAAFRPPKIICMRLLFTGLKKFTWRQHKGIFQD